MEKAVVFSGYHCGVNDCIVKDFGACGYTIYMPSDNWGRINFYAPNQSFQVYPQVKLVNWEQFKQLPPMMLLAACVQQANDFKRIWEERGKVDKLIWLTATQDAVNYPDDFADGIMTQDIHYHRKSKAKTKMLYLNKPNLSYTGEKDFKKSFESKQINFFINELTTHPRHEMILEDLRILREHFPSMKFYGFQSENGQLPQDQAHKLIVESMFTGGIKHWETWGQTVNESMLLKTPTLHLNKFNINILHDYLLTPDNCILTETVEEMIDRIDKMTLDEYEELCMNAYYSSSRMCNDEIRRENLAYFLNKLLCLS